MNVLDSALPLLMKRVLPSIQDTGRLLLSSDVAHIMSAIAGKPVDILYSRLTGLSCSFFSKGWGNLKVVNFAEDLEYLRSEWPSQQLQIEWKLQAEGYQDRKPYKVYEGTFKTPCVRRVWDALPPESRLGVVQLMVPASGFCNSAVIHLAATGDQGFTRRARLAAPLLSQGVASIILESPFYGCRKPTQQLSSKLDRVSDLLVLGWATIFESMHLLRWLEQNGYIRTGVCGTSMGGVHACLATSLYPNPVACVPFLAPRSAAVAYCDGAMWPVTAWQALLKDADDLDNDLISVLETATQAHNCGVQIRPARVSPNMLSQAQLSLPPQTNASSSTTPTTGLDSATTTPNSSYQQLDSLLRSLSLPALPQNEWLSLSNYSLWGIKAPSAANSSDKPSSSSTSQSTASSTASDSAVSSLPDVAPAPSRSSTRHSAPPSFLGGSSMNASTTESTAAEVATAQSHQTHHTKQLQGQDQQTQSQAAPTELSQHVQQYQAQHQETESTAATTAQPQQEQSQAVAHHHVHYSHNGKRELPDSPHESVSACINTHHTGASHQSPNPQSRCTVDNTAQATSVTTYEPVTVQSSRPSHSDIQHTSYSSYSSHSESSNTWDVRRCEHVQRMQASEQGQSNRREQMQAEVLQQLMQGNEGELRRAAEEWVAMESRMDEVAELQRHLSLMKLKAILEAFTDITRFPVPKRTDTAILIAAKDDGYVNMESVREVHEYWRGSEMRLVPGGHVSAFLTQQNAVRQAVVDALDRLGQPESTA